MHRSESLKRMWHGGGVEGWWLLGNVHVASEGVENISSTSEKTNSYFNVKI